MADLTNDQITAGAAVLSNNGKREGFEAAAKALQERAAGHYRNGDDELQDECLQCASMLHDMKPALAAPSPQVADIAELPPLPESLDTVAVHVPTIPERPDWTHEESFRAWEDYYTADQMRQYARDAIAASHRASGGEVICDFELKRLHRLLKVTGVAGAEELDADTSMACFWALIGEITNKLEATPTPASAGQAAPAMIEQYDGPWPTVEMTVAGKRMLEKQTSIEHIKKYSAGIANSIYEAMHAASPVGIAAQPAEGAGQAGQVALSEGMTNEQMIRRAIAELRALAPQELRQAGQVAKLADALNTMLWLYRRLPGAYGKPPFVDAALIDLAAIAGVDGVPEAIKERATLLDATLQPSAQVKP